MLDKQEIEKNFNCWKDIEKFSGVISLSNKDEVIYEKIQGFRNRGERLPNESDTLFGIASGTKLFTAAAICQLIDQGKLALDSLVWDILPYDLKVIDKGVTVFHLLTHTSGVIDYFNDDEALGEFDDIEDYFEKYPAHKWTNLEYYLPLFCEIPNKFKPGTETAYSNSGFILLGLIIEKISELSFHEYIKKYIIEPLNLTRTGFFATNYLPFNTALGYIYDEEIDDFVSNTFLIKIIGSPDGGLYTTAKEIAMFWSGIFEKKLFSEEMVNQLGEIYSEWKEEWGSVYFGLGVQVKEKEGAKIYYHDGWVMGVSFITMYCPQTECALTIFGNVNVDIFAIEDELMSLLIS